MFGYRAYNNEVVTVSIEEFVDCFITGITESFVGNKLKTGNIYLRIVLFANK